MAQLCQSHPGERIPTRSFSSRAQSDRRQRLSREGSASRKFASFEG